MSGGLAVVLSGGGAKGAFQVGVLDELIVNRGVQVDAFAGVSTGAIQALAGVQDDIPGLVQAWLALRGNKDVYRDRGGIVGGLLGNDSLYDASPIRARIRAFADERKLRATGKKLRLGVVSLTTGIYRLVAENTPGIANWVYASSAMPVFFRPLVTRAADGAEEQWVDGGVRDVTPLSAALELRPRAVLVISASPVLPAAASTRRYGNLLAVGLRAVSILQSEVVDNDTANAALINDLLAAREKQEATLLRAGVGEATRRAVLAPLDGELSRYYFAPVRVIAPEEDVAETLQFDPRRIRAGIEAGRRAASLAWGSLESFVRD